MLGLRPRAPLTLRQFTVSTGALVEGCALRQVGAEDLDVIERPTGPGGSLQEWTLFAVGLEALATAVLRDRPGLGPTRRLTPAPTSATPGRTAGSNDPVPGMRSAEEWPEDRRGGHVPRTTPAGERFDIVFVGDVAVDQYLTLAEDVVTVEDGPECRRLVLPFGAKVSCEVTAIVPAGGNSANAAVACARLGLRTALVAYVGDDGQGRGAVSALRAEGVDASLVRPDPAVPTNRNFVLRVGHERTILVHHEQHDCHWPHLRPAEVPSWLYLSSVGTDAHAYEDQIVDWLEYGARRCPWPSSRAPSRSPAAPPRSTGSSAGPRWWCATARRRPC